MERSPAADISFLVVLLLHEFYEKRVFIDNRTKKKTEKVIDMSWPSLAQI